MNRHPLDADALALIVALGCWAALVAAIVERITT